MSRERRVLAHPRVVAMPIAFNEARKIESVLERFEKLETPVDLAVFDDGSTDETPEVVRSRGHNLVRHERQQGVGAAIRSAFVWAREHGYDVCVIMAGNDKDRPAEIPRLVDPIARGEADLVQGSRYLKGGDFGNMPLYRRVTTQYIHPLLFSLAARRRMTDTTNGFRAVRLTMLDDERMRLDQEWLDRYELEPYLLFTAIRLGYSVVERPVTKIYPPAELGYTKMKPITGWWSILRPIVYLGLGLRK